MLVITIHNILAFYAYYHYYLYCCYKYYTFKMIEATQFNNPYSGNFYQQRTLSLVTSRSPDIYDEAVSRKFFERATLQKSIVTGQQCTITREC